MENRFRLGRSGHLLRGLRREGLLLVTTALLPLLVHCEVDTVATPPPAYATVQVSAPPPPPPTAEVQVGEAPPDQATEVADTDPSALADFHEALDPYGSWVDDGQYGTVWYPNRAAVGNDFTPYLTAGHWVYDNNDYLWVSDYDWGWAPFHYGRWIQTPRGWGWVPGHEYAGAWVTWRNGDDGYGYVGWAPTPPSYYWRGGVAVNVPPPEPVFIYLSANDLFAPNVGVRVLPRARYREFEGRTRLYAPVRGEGGGRVMVRGPAPTRFGIAPDRIARPPANNPGLQRAQQFRVHPVAHPAPQGGPPGGARPGGPEYHGTPPGQQGGPGGAHGGPEYHGTPPGQQQGGPGAAHGGPEFHGTPPPQQGGAQVHPQATDQRPDLQGHTAPPQQHPTTPQPPPDPRTRPQTPTQQQMHAAPPATQQQQQHPVAPPQRKR